MKIILKGIQSGIWRIWATNEFLAQVEAQLKFNFLSGIHL